MIVQLTGGLGNTLFQYAFGLGVKIKTGRQLGFCWQRATRDYTLDRYVNIQLVTNPSGPSYNERSICFDEGVYHPAAAEYYFRGYWQTERYFSGLMEWLRCNIRLRTHIDREWLVLGEKMAATNSVFIHVRRGDYLKPQNIAAHGLLPLEYYSTAMAIVRRQIPDLHFYAFSDDPEWCLNNLPDATVLPTPNADVDLYLMRHCQHGIIANSSFSWWAAWLGPDSTGMVIAPSKWFGPANQHFDTKDLLPIRWLKV